MKKFIVLSSACGVGKSTIKEELNKKKLLENYACIDTDEVGINWWDYAGMSGEKNLLFVTCMNPYDFYGKVHIPSEIASTFFIGMTCSDDEIKRRLKARPAERMCGSDEFITGQIQYNNWFKENAGKFQFYIDNTDLTIDETVEEHRG